MSTCFCIGAQNGEPLCPCWMKNVVIRNGRYVREEDLGVVKNIDIITKELEDARRRYWDTPSDAGDFK